MSIRENAGRSLLECLREVSSLLDHARSVALKQQEALVKNDAEMIVLTARAQEEVLRRIGDSDQRAAALGVELAESAGLDPETADTDALADAAGHPYSELIRLEMARIMELAEQVHSENQVCATLLNNGLDIIACCLRTLASDPGTNFLWPERQSSRVTKCGIESGFESLRCPVTFFGISVTQSGLAAQRRAMDVLGYNIANANNPTYKRQRLVMVEGAVLAQSQEADPLGSSAVGSGVNSGDVERVLDPLIENRPRQAGTASANWNYRQSTLSQLEAQIGEPSDTGLQTDLDNFWASWQKVATSPDPYRPEVGFSKTRGFSASV